MSADRWEFRLLGTVEAIAGGRIVDLGRRQERCLLGLLLLEVNRPVPVERLMALLWESPGPTARNTIRTYIARLRSRLIDGGIKIRRSGEGYVIGVDPYTVDLHRFKADVARAARLANEQQRAQVLRDALALWRGPLLAGVATDAVWERIVPTGEDIRLQAVEGWAEAELACGRCEDVITDLDKLVQQHPFRERLVGLLMLALHRAGRQGDALALYRHTRARLVDELGIEPGIPLQRIHHQLLGGNALLGPPSVAARGTARPRLLPQRIPDFIGRTSELDRLDAITAGGGSSAVVISAIAGLGGVGKTALALHWADRRADRFPDGQLYVNLRGFDAGEPLRPIDALAILLAALRVPLEEIPAGEAAAGLYRSLLAGKRTLVVLDNARTAAQIRPLLPGGEANLVLVTSRDALAGLIALDGARPLRLDALTAEDSRDLLARMIGDRRVAAEPGAAADLARLCGHLPLALRIVGANLAMRPTATLADQVAAMTGAGTLDSLEIAEDPQASVRAVFAHSYAALTGGDQRYFRLAGLVPGPDFRVAAAAALAAATVEEAGAAVARLVAAHLLTDTGNGRFQLHDLLRVYARERAYAEETEPEAALGRLYTFYLGHLDAAARTLYPNQLRLPLDPGIRVQLIDHAAAAEWLEAELRCLTDTIRHTSANGPHETAWLLADALRGYLLLRSNWVDWLAAAGHGLSAARAAGDRRAETACQLSLGMAAHNTGDCPAAARHYRAARALARETGWQHAEAAAIGNLGSVYLQLGQLDRAARHYERAIAANRRIGDPTGTTSYLINLGIVHTRTGRLRDACGRLSEAVDAARRLDHLGILGAALHCLGDAHRYLGTPDLAAEILDEAHATYAAAGNTGRAAFVQVAQAMIHHDTGRLDVAFSLAQEALTVLTDLDRRVERAYALAGLGIIETTLERRSDAERHLTEALAVARGLGSSRAEIIAEIALADARHATGRLDLALDHATHALTLAQDTGHRVEEGRALTALAGICLSGLETDRSVAYARQALANHQETGHAPGEAHTLRIIHRLTTANR
jgi:DNA-binding SARP family transcriptional activator/tetratricopeptide (TPR) repeat protein